MQKAIDARTEYNNLVAKHISGNDQTLTMAEQLQQVEKASEAAKESISKLFDMMKKGQISNTDFEKVVEGYYFNPN